jgi:hypothetical protein
MVMIDEVHLLNWIFPGGGERTRTVGLYIANVALYQLSYTPGPDEISRLPRVPRPPGSATVALEPTRGESGVATTDLLLGPIQSPRRLSLLS